MISITENEHVLVKGDGVVRGMIKPDIPANLPQLGGFLGVISGIPIYADVKLAMDLLKIPGEGISNSILHGLLNKLTFSELPHEVGSQTEAQVVVLEKDDGNIDIAINIANNYQTSYSSSIRGYHPKRSMYQDQVRFKIWPKDPSKLTINHRGSMPRTDLKEASYSSSTNWSSKFGFEAGVDKDGPSASVSGETGCSFTVGAGSSAKDFEISKVSEGQSDVLIWVSRMRNMYAAGSTQAIAGGYNPENCYSLVVNGAFTKWLNDPAAAAQSDLYLEYLAAYTSMDPSIKENIIEFEFLTTQQLMHAEIVGRWGIPGIQVGGVAAVIPYYVATKGEIKIDLSERRVEVKKLQTEGYNMSKLAEAKANCF